MDPSVGHLNGIFARVVGNLNNNFHKSQMPGGLPGGAGGSFDLTDTLYDLYFRKGVLNTNEHSQCEGQKQH